MKNPEVFYTADYLGVIGEKQYEVFGHFFASGGLERVSQRLPYIVGGTVDKAALRKLDRLIKFSMGSTEFVANTRTAAPLRNRKQDIEFWNRFQGSVVEVLCGDLVSLHAEAGEIVISNQQLHQALKRQQRTHSMVEALYHFNVRFGKNTYACPDGLGVNLGVSPEVVIRKIYEYKSTPVGKEHSTGQASKDRLLLKDSRFRELLRIGVADIQGVDPLMVQIPSKSIRVILVSAQESIFKGINLKDYYDDYLTLGLPNVRAAAYFILKCMLGDILEYSNWKNYFQVVSPEVAKTIDTIRAGSTNPGMRGRR